MLFLMWYFLNIGCFSVWYRFIYNKSNVTFFELLHKISRHLRIQLRYIVVPQKRTKDLSAFFESNSLRDVKKKTRNVKECENSNLALGKENEYSGISQEIQTKNKYRGLYYLFVVLCALIAWAVISGIFSMLISDMLLVHKILFIVCGMFIIFGVLIKYNSEVSDFLYEYIIFLILLSRVAKLQSYEYEPYSININRALIIKNLKENFFTFIVLFLIIIIIICHLITEGGTSTFNMGHEFIYSIVLIIIVTIYKFADSDMRKSSKEKRIYKKIMMRERREWNRIREIVVDPDLSEWATECLKICKALHIEKLYVTTASLGTKLAISGKDALWGHFIIVGSEYMNLLSSSLNYSEYQEAIAFILGHEIVHLHYKDYDDKASMLKRDGIMFIIYFLLIIGSVILAKYVSVAILFMPLFVLLCIFPFFWFILTNDRYWKQVAELRADRIGMSLSGSSLQVMEKMLRETGYHINDFVQEGLVERIVKKYSEVDAHPSIELRIQELKRNKPWGLNEYFRYGFILKIWKK